MVTGRLTNKSRVLSLSYFYMYNISCKIYGHTFSKTFFPALPSQITKILMKKKIHCKEQSPWK